MKDGWVAVVEVFPIQHELAHSNIIGMNDVHGVMKKLKTKDVNQYCVELGYPSD